jgi:hypothetical protein
LAESTCEPSSLAPVTVEARQLGGVSTFTPNGQLMERGNGSTTAGIRSQDGEAA